MRVFGKVHYPGSITFQHARPIRFARTMQFKGLRVFGRYKEFDIAKVINLFHEFKRITVSSVNQLKEVKTGYGFPKYYWHFSSIPMPGLFWTYIVGFFFFWL